MKAVSGAEVLVDDRVSHEGRSSLRITFDGSKNVYFHHAYQFVRWKPNTEYVLSAYLKTESVTTKSGVKLEVLGLNPAFRHTSESLRGDNGWTLVSVRFLTPSGSLGGIVRIRRERTEKFDRFISGTAWIDGVQLRETTQKRGLVTKEQSNAPVSPKEKANSD
jgi:hypothetical protein